MASCVEMTTEVGQLPRSEERAADDCTTGQCVLEYYPYLCGPVCQYTTALRRLKTENRQGISDEWTSSEEGVYVTTRWEHVTRKLITGHDRKCFPLKNVQHRMIPPTFQQLQEWRWLSLPALASRVNETLTFEGVVNFWWFAYRKDPSFFIIQTIQGTSVFLAPCATTSYYHTDLLTDYGFVWIGEEVWPWCNRDSKDIANALTERTPVRMEFELLSRILYRTGTPHPESQTLTVMEDEYESSDDMTFKDALYKFGYLLQAGFR